MKKRFPLSLFEVDDEPQEHSSQMIDFRPVLRKARNPCAGCVTPPDKLTKPQKKVWMHMKVHPYVTNYWAIVRGAGVARHTAAKWYETIREMLGRTT